MLDNLIRRGYFPKELPPAFETVSFADALGNILPLLDNFEKKSSSCAYFSMPKIRHARRNIGVPNPLHQLRLSKVIADNWCELDHFMRQSRISLSTPQVDNTLKRALVRSKSWDEVSLQKCICSSAARFMVRVDLSRFYSTLYTHSIAWALHTKEEARRRQLDETLVGVALDMKVRNTQEKQTLGIPVGPDTSDVIAEILAAAIDQRIQAEIPNLTGIRYVDDYFLYFPTRSEAEQSLKILARSIAYFNLELNDLKTSIHELPDVPEPVWKADLRSFVIRQEREQLDLLAFFSKAYDYAIKYPGNNVLKYALRCSKDHLVPREHWQLYESFLLSCLVAEPSLAPTVAVIFREYSERDYTFDSQKLAESLSTICDAHSNLGHGFEVAWSLWFCKLFSVSLPERILQKVSQIEDSVIALIALDLRERGLVNNLDTQLWERRMDGNELYSNNWMLAYEAYISGWLPSRDGADYIGGDPFFATLRDNKVQFYDVGVDQPVTEALSWLGY